jgi:hypothetical protein
MNKESIWNSLLKLKSLPFGSVHCIEDAEKKQEVIEIIKRVADQQCLDDIGIQEKFISKYREWISGTRLNSVKGLEQFPVATVSNGTTESFDKFYLKHKNKRFRFFRGEYMYHLAASNAYFEKFSYIEEEELAEGDAVIFSLPFADTGEEHVDMHRVLKRCDELQIPVLIDCCYFGCCGEVEFDFTYQCIEVLAFSLSKVFPIQNIRIGIRFTRIDDDDPLLVYNKNKYVNRLGAAVGFEMMDRYGPDYNFETYKTVQQDFCDTLGVSASKCVFFATSTDSFKEYNRGTDSNRLCFSKYLKSKKLPNY